MSNIKLEGLDEALATLDPKLVGPAARRSVNIVTKSGRTAASDQIRKVWNIKKAELDARINVVEARATQTGAQIIFGGRGIATAYFDAVQFTANVARRVTKKGTTTKARKKVYELQGVRTEVKVGKRVELPGAFLVKLKSGHVGVFHRLPGTRMRKKNKEQILEKGVVSVATMFKQPRVYAAFLNRVYEQWQKVFPHELEQQRKRRGGD